MNGIFPKKYEDILQLKGVGPYTASAIASFAYNLPHAVVDGNVYRVLARFFGETTPTDSTEGKKIFTALANECLHKKNAGIYNQAIMDFGATVCTPVAPICDDCVFQKKCIANLDETQSQLPFSGKLKAKQKRNFLYFLIENKQKILVEKRAANDIWKGLHQFYLHEENTEIIWTEKAIKKTIKNIFKMESKILSSSKTFTQQLTHRTVQAVFIQLQVKENFIIPPNFFWVNKNEINKLAFPKLINQYLETADL